MESTGEVTRAQQRRITRNRELRACVECRRRKLKCDRHLPCGACVRRSEPTTCFYERKFEGRNSDAGRRLQAEARLEHLEQLVQELSDLQQTSTNPHDTPGNLSALQRERDETFNDALHSGATHWSAMLEDIEELRTAMVEDEDMHGSDRDDRSGGDDGIGLLFGAGRSLSLEQILSKFLPPRQEVDRTVAAYFRARAISAPFIHSPSFSRLYATFWENPIAAPPLWTSLLFSILDISTRTILSSSGIDETEMDRFAVAAANCLVIAEYNKPQRFAVEALLLYAQARCITSVDLSSDVAVVFGTLCRLATIMGYHRDPDRSPDISPFAGEIRRRVFSLCMQLDMLVSFQLGLPSNFQWPTWDTRPPANLLDADFDEDAVQLPPARADSEPTELLFYIVKHKLMAVFEKIIRSTLSTLPSPDSDIDLLDQELQSTYEGLPAVYQPRPMASSVVDSPSLIVTRLCVTQIYKKCRCVLHRKYVARGRQESIQVCYESASDLVGQFLDIFREFESGGQLHSEHWFMGSLTWHDFLLGCTCLCLTLCRTREKVEFSMAASQRPSSVPVMHSPVATINVEASLQMLQQATAIFDTPFAKGHDTRKVRRLIDATIVAFSRASSGRVPTTKPKSSTDEDDAWAFMEQFLDLPRRDSMEP